MAPSESGVSAPSKKLWRIVALALCTLLAVGAAAAWVVLSRTSRSAAPAFPAPGAAVATSNPPVPPTVAETPLGLSPSEATASPAVDNAVPSPRLALPPHAVAAPAKPRSCAPGDPLCNAGRSGSAPRQGTPSDVGLGY